MVGARLSRVAPPPSVQDEPRRSVARYRVWLGIGVTLLVAFAILTGIELTLLGEGSIVVNIAATDGLPVGPFKLLVDGEKVACERAACTITRLSLGAHVVELVAQGFAVPAAQNPRVKALQTLSIGFMLVPLPMALRVAGTQPGARLMIDENEIGPLPQLVTGLARGPHQLRVLSDDDYEPWSVKSRSRRGSCSTWET
jgi:hypothetical protein